MVQEFVSILHLTDIKIALYDESVGPYPQYSIYELDKFLDKYFVENDGVRSNIKNGIIRELYYIFNYLDEPVQFLEKASLVFPIEQINDTGIEIPQKIEYLRVNKNLKGKVADREFVEVKGVILKENVITMRTEGVVVDAFLGQGEGLDSYSQGLQVETVRELHLNNNTKEQEIEKQKLMKTIIEENDDTKALIFSKLHPCCHNNKQAAEVNPSPPTDE